MKISSFLLYNFFLCWGCSEPSPISSSIQKEEKIEIQIDYALPSSSKWHGIITSDSGLVIQKGEKETFLRLSKKQLDSIATLTEQFYQSSYHENPSVSLQEYYYIHNDSVRNILSVPLKEEIIYIPKRLLDRISISRQYNSFQWTVSYLYTPKLRIQYQYIRNLLWYIDFLVK
ncbi:hypothetical protein AD998_11770 [bacterium 336/3]|nr:hypothetical protein AD998_11770 [bacterium 336/3]